VLRMEWEIIASGDEGPGPRSRHGLVYDRGAKAVVLFGGLIWAKRRPCQCDTWELHRDEWRLVQKSSPPPARHRGAMVFDAFNGCSVLFGGQDNGNAFLADTWLYEDQKWKKRAFWFWSHPSPRCGHAMAFDEALGQTVLFGGISPLDRPLGDTWTFDGSRWRKWKGKGPPARRYAALAYHPVLKGCVLHGGAVDDNGHEVFGDTWLFRDGQWSPMSDAFDTTKRDDHGLGYHEVAGVMVMLEGLSRPREVLGLGKTGWHEVELERMHPRLQCSPLAYTAHLNGLIMHGGEVSHGGDQFDDTLILRLADNAQ
jgi:hypothetical protein